MAQPSALCFPLSRSATAGIQVQFLCSSSTAGVPVWLSGRALRQLRKRLWVRFPGNTCTSENV